jgi:hypothetical protein
MPTPFESALLNLQLFELRREPAIRRDLQDDARSSGAVHERDAGDASPGVRRHARSLSDEFADARANANRGRGGPVDMAAQYRVPM